MKSHSFLQIGPFYQTMLVSSFPRKFSQSLMHVHSCVHLGADHELCRFSWAGRQTFCCFDSKYSCHFVEANKGLLAIFSCPVVLGLRYNTSKSDSPRVKSSYPKRLSAFESVRIYSGGLRPVVSQGFHVGQNSHPADFPWKPGPTLLAKWFWTQYSKL